MSRILQNIPAMLKTEFKFIFASSLVLQRNPGDGWAVFMRGLTSGTYFPENPDADNIRFSLGGGDDFLYFQNQLALPVNLGSGRDFVLAGGASENADVTDYDEAEGFLVVLP